MFLVRVIFLFAPFIVLGVTNPALVDFEKVIKDRISEESTYLGSGIRTLRRITGVTTIKQKTGIKSYELCRKNLYLGSMYVARTSSLTESNHALAGGFGIGTKVFLLDLREKPQNSPSVLLTKNLEFAECQDFLG